MPPLALSQTLMRINTLQMSTVRMRGRPYDTLEEVIGLRGTPGHGSLREWGVTYRELPLAEGSIDWAGLAEAIRPGVSGCRGRPHRESHAEKRVQISRSASAHRFRLFRCVRVPNILLSVSVEGFGLSS